MRWRRAAQVRSTRGKVAIVKRYALSIIFCALTASTAFAQTKTPVEGVWKIAERILPGTNSLATSVATPNTLWLIPTPDNATTEPRIKLTKLE